MSKNAYITLFSNEEYLHCLIGLYGSWKDTNSKYPFLCAITSNISAETQKILTDMGMELIHLPALELPPTVVKNNAKRGIPLSFYRALPKLQLFSLPYDKLVYLDSDLWIMQNIDELFNYPHMAGVVDLAFLQPDRRDWETPGDKWFRMFNAGVLVIQPQPDLTQRFLDMMQWLPSDRVWSDQNILAAYYRNWDERHELHLPVYYNVLITGLDAYCSYAWFNLCDVKIMHFVASYKPVPRIWGAPKLKLPDQFPIVSAYVSGYFDIIDRYIQDYKTVKILPPNFPFVKDLQGEEKNVALYNNI